jgi:hypothetical protein
MAGSDLRDLTARLQRVRIRGEIVEGDQRELIGRQVEVVVAPVQVQRNIEASTAGRSPLSIETPFILSPLAASRLGTQRLSEPGTKVLGPRSIDYWGRGGGFNCIQTLKTERQGYISPRAYAVDLCVLEILLWKKTLSWSEIKGPVHTQSGFGAPKYHNCHYFL